MPSLIGIPTAHYHALGADTPAIISPPASNEELRTDDALDPPPAGAAHRTAIAGEEARQASLELTSSPAVAGAVTIEDHLPVGMETVKMPTEAGPDTIFSAQTQTHVENGQSVPEVQKQPAADSASDSTPLAPYGGPAPTPFEAPGIVEGPLTLAEHLKSMKGRRPLGKLPSASDMSDVQLKAYLRDSVELPESLKASASDRFAHMRPRRLQHLRDSRRRKAVAEMRCLELQIAQTTQRLSRLEQDTAEAPAGEDSPAVSNERHSLLAELQSLEERYRRSEAIIASVGEDEISCPLSLTLPKNRSTSSSPGIRGKVDDELWQEGTRRAPALVSTV